MRETSWQSWAYEADMGDLIMIRDELGIMLSEWVDTEGAHSSARVLTARGIIDVRIDQHVTIYRFHDDA
jgi:hypothetical protein